MVTNVIGQHEDKTSWTHKGPRKRMAFRLFEGGIPKICSSSSVSRRVSGTFIKMARPSFQRRLSAS